jgi:hypothetical protein
MSSEGVSNILISARGEVHIWKNYLYVGVHSSAWIEWLPAEQLVEGSSPSGPEPYMTLYLGPHCNS